MVSELLTVHLAARRRERGLAPQEIASSIFLRCAQPIGLLLSEPPSRSSPRLRADHHRRNQICHPLCVGEFSLFQSDQESQMYRRPENKTTTTVLKGGVFPTKRPAFCSRRSFLTRVSISTGNDSKVRQQSCFPCAIITNQRVNTIRKAAMTAKVKFNREAVRLTSDTRLELHEMPSASSPRGLHMACKQLRCICDRPLGSSEP